MPEVIFGTIALLATVLYIREYGWRKKIEREVKPGPEDQAGFKTIAELTQKSQELTKEAELNANKLVEEAKEFDLKQTQDFGQQLANLLETEKTQTKQSQTVILDEFKSQEEKFESFMKQLSTVLENKTQSSVVSFNAFLEQLRREAETAQSANWEGARARISELFENFETKLADFLLQTEQKMMVSVDLELKSARQLIDTYKVQQMNMIDENIVAMLEKTLSLVMSKNLNLKDQMDLVYDSLEKAKNEAFLV